MLRYIMPIIWSFITYTINRALPVIVFIIFLFITWSSGYNFSRSPSTAAILVFGIGTSLIFPYVYKNIRRISNLYGIEHEKTYNMIVLSICTWAIFFVVFISFIHFN